MYRPNTILNKRNYGRIITGSHFNRLKELRDKAVSEGAIIVKGGTEDEQDHTMEPTLLSKVPHTSAIMQEEIFGPLLPIIPYGSLDEAVDFVNKRPKPLALYVFSGTNSVIQSVIRKTSAGGTCINDVVLHISNPNLPFGGVGNSGSGNCHGFFGFKAFSHERGIMFQSRLDFSRLAYPPFRDKSRLLKWLKKIF